MVGGGAVTEAKQKKEARSRMRGELYDDPNATATELAEVAAWEMDHDEWLDDPDHWIWDIALEVVGDRE